MRYLCVDWSIKICDNVIILIDYDFSKLYENFHDIKVNLDTRGKSRYRLASNTMKKPMLQSGRSSGYHVPGALESSWELVKRFLWYLFVLDFWRSRGKKNLTSSLNRHASIEILVSGNVAKVEKSRDSFLPRPFSHPFSFNVSFETLYPPRRFAKTSTLTLPFLLNLVM